MAVTSDVSTADVGHPQADPWTAWQQGATQPQGDDLPAQTDGAQAQTQGADSARVDSDRGTGEQESRDDWSHDRWYHRHNWWGHSWEESDSGWSHSAGQRSWDDNDSNQSHRSSGWYPSDRWYQDEARGWRADEASRQNSWARDQWKGETIDKETDDWNSWGPRKLNTISERMTTSLAKTSVQTPDLI